jgi:hypothetical protein
VVDKRPNLRRHLDGEEGEVWSEKGPVYTGTPKVKKRLVGKGPSLRRHPQRREEADSDEVDSRGGHKTRYINKPASHNEMMMMRWWW